MILLCYYVDDHSPTHLFRAAQGDRLVLSSNELTSWKAFLALQTKVFESPRRRRASVMSLGMIVTRFACSAHKLQSSNNEIMYASVAS